MCYTTENKVHIWYCTWHFSSLGTTTKINLFSLWSTPSYIKKKTYPFKSTLPSLINTLTWIINSVLTSSFSPLDRDSTTPKSTFESIPSVLEVSQLSVSHDSQLHNFTLLHLAGEGDVAQVMERVALLAGNSSKPKQAYWTSGKVLLRWGAKVCVVGAWKEIKQDYDNDNNTLQSPWVGRTLIYILCVSDVGGGWGVKQKHAVLVTGAAHLSHLALLQTLFPHHRNITTAVSQSLSNKDKQLLIPLSV